MNNEKIIKTAGELFQQISDLAIDYDGYSTADGLKSLIDDMREIADRGIILCNTELISKVIGEASLE